MKLKTILYPAVGILITASVLSCSKDYIELDPLGQPLVDNYYSNEVDFC